MGEGQSCSLQRLAAHGAAPSPSCITEQVISREQPAIFNRHSIERGLEINSGNSS
jgi:hypothetical protein